jgi:hypothetical protein
MPIADVLSTKKNRVYCEPDVIIDIEHESRVACFAILFGRKMNIYVIPAAIER